MMMMTLPLGLGLRPVVRLGQWPRTIRDFSDDSGGGQHQVYTTLARAYRAFAAALPLPPDGSPLEVVVHNELNGGTECTATSPSLWTKIRAFLHTIRRGLFRARVLIGALESDVLPDWGLQGSAPATAHCL